MKAPTLALVYLDGEPVNLMGDPRPSAAKVVASTGKRADDYFVKMVDADGKDIDPDTHKAVDTAFILAPARVIDRTEEPTKAIYLATVPRSPQVPPPSAKAPKQVRRVGTVRLLPEAGAGLRAMGLHLTPKQAQAVADHFTLVRQALGRHANEDKFVAATLAEFERALMPILFEDALGDDGGLGQFGEAMAKQRKAALASFAATRQALDDLAAGDPFNEVVERTRVTALLGDATEGEA